MTDSILLESYRLRPLYIYDPKKDDLRYKKYGSIAGSFVPAEAVDVLGRDLILVGKQLTLVPRQEVIRHFCSDIKRDFSTGGSLYDPEGDPPSQERVRELFDHDAINGVLIHKKNRRGVTAGTVAGSKPGRRDKALEITIDGFHTTVHRAIYIWVYGVYPRDPIFHRDWDKTNNTLENLYVKPRLTPPTTQTHYEENSFGVRSVFRNLKIQKWCSMLQLDVDICHIGYHDTLMDAVKDVVRAGIRHDRVRCIEVDEAIAYLKEHEPEYLESLGL
jgi:hypothetical protein